MPWTQTDALKERVKFALEWERRWKLQEGQVNVAELCREYGVSRQTGHTWIRRYCAADRDLAALADRSKRPHGHPRAIPIAVQDFVVSARKAHPRWGPRKLRAWLLKRYPDRPLPSPSAMSAILKRRGMVTPRRRRKRASYAVTQPFAACDRPNATWCVDFKGWFKTEDGKRCYPLTILDGFSRYLIRCEAILDPNGIEVQRVFDSAFREFGLPVAIRSDNGPPFASTGPGGLTHLNVWWLRLGIRLERIQPGKPQQNGRQERFHRSLKLDVPPQANVHAQQRAFDFYRREYNEERPHEALSLTPPATVYVTSRVAYPRPLLRPDGLAGAGGHECRADGNGCIEWRKRKVFISNALSGEYLVLEPDEGARWAVSFGPLLLGHIDELRLDRGLIRSRDTKVKPKAPLVTSII